MDPKPIKVILGNDEEDSDWIRSPEYIANETALHEEIVRMEEERQAKLREALDRRLSDTEE